MYKNIKDIIIIVLVVLALCAGVWCFLLKKVAISERLLAEDSLFNETIAEKKAQEKLSRVDKEKEGLKKNVSDLMKKAMALDNELAGYKNAISFSKRQLSRLNNDSILAQREITQIDSNFKNLKNRVDYISKDTMKISEKLTLLTKTRDALQDRLSRYEQEEPLEQIQYQANDDVPDTATYASAAPAVEQSNTSLAGESAAIYGEVLTINREFAFIVISLGRRDGITEGMVFNIQRDNRNIGQIRVETARENISAAALIDKHTLSEIRAGDMVFPQV